MGRRNEKVQIKSKKYGGLCCWLKNIVYICVLNQYLILLK